MEFLSQNAKLFLAVWTIAVVGYLRNLLYSETFLRIIMSSPSIHEGRSNSSQFAATLEILTNLQHLAFDVFNASIEMHFLSPVIRFEYLRMGKT